MSGFANIYLGANEYHSLQFNSNSLHIQKMPCTPSPRNRVNPFTLHTNVFTRASPAARQPDQPHGGSKIIGCACGARGFRRPGRTHAGATTDCCTTCSAACPEPVVQQIVALPALLLLVDEHTVHLPKVATGNSAGVRLGRSRGGFPFFVPVFCSRW